MSCVGVARLGELAPFFRSTACNNRSMLTEESRRICVESVEFVFTEMERFQRLFESGASCTQTFGDGATSLAEFMAKV
jgi:hypothetical protein